MVEKNQIDENETRIRSSAKVINKHGQTYGYSCIMCGNHFTANPSDDVHRLSSVYQCWKFDWIERNYQCNECHNTTNLYWHPKLHKNYDYATSQEIKYTIDKDSSRNDTNPYLQRMIGY
jgi:NAD-dependent SIR2 family protein deacetylase